MQSVFTRYTCSYVLSTWSLLLKHPNSTSWRRRVTQYTLTVRLHQLHRFLKRTSCFWGAALPLTLSSTASPVFPSVFVQPSIPVSEARPRLRFLSRSLPRRSEHRSAASHIKHTQKMVTLAFHHYIMKGSYTPVN